MELNGQVEMYLHLLVIIPANCLFSPWCEFPCYFTAYSCPETSFFIVNLSIPL